ncbi:TonB-dependent receptor [bacterium]|nr:TonB-dependent receptor [bacterium]
MRRHIIPITLFLITALYIPLLAQTPAVQGKVSNALTGETLPGVHVRILHGTEHSFVAGAYTDTEGDFQITTLEDGRYTCVISCIGFETDTRNIDVNGNTPLKLNVTLNEEVLDMQQVVVTASRRKEKVLDAPASVAVLTTREMEQRNALTVMDHVQGVQGVDVAEKGVMQREYVARGLNNVFNGTMRTLVDNRLTNLPSLRANISYLQSIDDADIDRIEVVLGPGSALYGPNVTNGVTNIITKSPFASRGTDVSIMGGSQSLASFSGRHAGTVGGRFGYKVSAGYLSAEDWQFTDPVEPYPEDRSTERYSVDARMDYLAGDHSTITVNAGRSSIMRGLDLTDNGAVLAKDFSFSHVQSRFTSGDFFGQVYINMNDAGSTYLLRADQPIVDNSKKIVAELQNGSRIADWQRFTYGADMYLTRPETDGTIMGRNENNDDVNEFGAYLQSDTRLIEGSLSLLLAGRVDYHSALENPVFSPRAGLRYTPAENHSIRATYNQAYLTPAISDLFLDLLVAEDIFDTNFDPMMYNLRNVGVPESGYSFQRQNGDLVFYSASNPGMGLPVGQAGAYWELSREAVLAEVELPPDLIEAIRSIPNPDPTQVGGALAMLNLETQGFDPVAASSIRDIDRLTPTDHQSWELGYKGMVNERIQLGVDLYYSEYENFITPARVATPNVFLNGEQTAAYLYQYLSQGIPPDQAQQIAAQLAEGMAQVPLGTVTPEQAYDRTELLMIPVNYGNINYWGTDVTVKAELSRTFSIGGTYSYISQVYFDDVDGQGPLSLNVPQHKASLSLLYTEPSTGIQGTARYRFVNGHRVKSGVYEGYINSYGLIDLGVRIPVPLPLHPHFVLGVRNALDHKHVQYVGGGEIGRLLTAKMQIRF